MRRPNMHGKVARAAISAALAGTMAFGGVLAPMGTAFAAGEKKITFFKNDEAYENEEKYAAYRVFNAGKVDPDTYVATDVEWVDTDMQNIVLPYLNTWNYDAWLKGKNLTDNKSAQNALLFISEMIAEDETNGGSYAVDDTRGLNIVNMGKHVTGSDSFANGLAIAIATAKAGTPTATSIVNDAYYSLSGEGKNNGYSIISEAGEVAADSTSGTNTLELTDTENGGKNGFYVLVPEMLYSRTDAGVFSYKFQDHSPIWFPYTGSDVQIMVKNYDGTIAKTVLDDATGATWGSVADAAREQALKFRLTVTLPSNYGENLTIEDTLPAGMEAVSGSAYVYGDAFGLKEADKKAITMSASGKTLTFDLKNAAGVTISQSGVGTEAIVEYEAQMTNLATTGLDQYNTNTAVLKYSTSGKTTESSANVTAYQLALHLIDMASREDVVGTNATFTIQDEDNRYLTADGRLVGVETVLDLKSMSTLTIPFIDEGKFTVTQLTAPDGYQLASPTKTTVTVTAEKKQGKVTSLKAVAEGGNAEVVSIVDGNGLITVDIPNIKNDTIILPITGMTPSQLGTLAGALLLVAAVGTFIVVRRRSEEAAE